MSLHLDVITETLKALEDYGAMKVMASPLDRHSFSREQQPGEAQYQKFQQDSQLISSLQPFIEIVAQVSAHPSRRLASIMIRDWLKVGGVSKMRLPIS